MNKMVLSLMCLLLSGCVYQTAEVRTSSFDEQMETPTADYSAGSLWQKTSVGLAADLKARQPGDIVTVVIAEQASASKEAATKTGRTSSVDAGIPNLFGLESNMTGIKNWMDLSKLISASAASSFDGSGTTTRKENLTATITAKVVHVLANGNMQIEGRRNVKVNNEDQVIVLAGTIRPRDISPDNLVSSSSIADARISYTGKGIVSDRQKPGWLMNAVDKIWPF